jgi:hypothetical protein
MGAAPPPKRPGGGLTSMIAGILALVTAGLVVGGSFAPITSYRNALEIDGDSSVFSTDSGWWGMSDTGSTETVEAESSLIGLALVLVAALLVLGAVFALVASRTRTSAPTTGGRSLISAGTGVLLGALLMQGLLVVEQASTLNEQELQSGQSIEYSPGLGLILPLIALALGLIAVVLAHVGQKPQAARVEPNTPRMGFPAPFGYQQQAPGTPPHAQAAPAESSDEDDAATTQRVSNATATGASAVSEPLSGEPSAPTPAPVTPATTSEATPATAEGATPAKPATTPEEAPPAPAESPTTSPAPESPPKE